MTFDFSIFSPVWWWVIIGLLLIAAELLTPGFWLIFFGFAALATAIVNGIFPGVPLSFSITLCAILGALLLYLSRRLFPDFFASRNNTDESEKHIETDDVAGARAVVAEAITPACPGKVDFRGSLWIAEADADIPAGEHVVIIERRNLTLFVKKI